MTPTTQAFNPPAPSAAGVPRGPPATSATSATRSRSHPAPITPARPCPALPPPRYFPTPARLNVDSILAALDLAAASSAGAPPPYGADGEDGSLSNRSTHPALLDTTFLTPRSSPPRRPPPSQRGPEYSANVGKVIETLRADYPQMLTTPPDFSIYTDNIIFRDWVTFDIRGKDAYASFFWALRLHTRIFFAVRDSRVEITSLYHDDAAGLVYLRWRMTARPRFTPRAGEQARAHGRTGVNEFVYDGMSLYRLDLDGMVYEHDWDNWAHRRGKPVRPLFETAARLGTISAAGLCQSQYVSQV